jgi:hypothetical protein
VAELVELETDLVSERDYGDVKELGIPEPG